jgi:radical SAM superfamily enzyme YgiQ (UPF0313 family)
MLGFGIKKFEKIGIKIKKPEIEKKFPLGLLYLASVAELMDHKVFVKYGNECNINFFLKKFKPDIVCLSSMAFQYPNTIKICEEIKKNDKDIPIALGGYFPTFMFNEILLNNKNIDYIVVGEGEKTFSELLEYFECGKNLKKIKGLAFKKKGKVIFTGRRNLIDSLDSIPFPARHLASSEHFCTSRGCYLNCKYCCIKNFYNKSFRIRSVRNVIEELNIMEEMDYKKVFFIDDCFLWDKKWLNSFLEEIRKNKIDLKFRCITRPELLDKGTIAKIEKSNFYMVGVGIQSLSNSYLKYLNTNLSIQKINKFISNTKKSSIKFRLYYIINSSYPTETEKDIWKNFNKLLKLIKDRKNFLLSPFIMTPLPGSDLREELKKRKIEFDINWKNYTLNKCTFNYNNLNKKTVDKIFMKMMEILKEKDLLLERFSLK